MILASTIELVKELKMKKNSFISKVQPCWESNYNSSLNNSLNLEFKKWIEK
jgi:hypothetical protein